MIKCPGIEAVLKQRILDSYEEARKETGELEYEYVAKKLPRVLKVLSNTSKATWKQKMAKRAGTLWELLEINQCLDDESYHSIVAALFYLCNPFDIIPDYTPGIGYVDDALVVNSCVKLLKKKSIHLIDEPVLSQNA